MTRSEALKKIKGLVNFQFSEIPQPKKTASVIPIAKPVPAKQKFTPVKKNTDGSIDVVSLSIAIAELQEVVPLMANYVQLRNDYGNLKKQLERVEAGFSRMEKGVQETIKLMQEETPEQKADKELKAWHESNKSKKGLKKYFK